MPIYNFTHIIFLLSVYNILGMYEYIHKLKAIIVMHVWLVIKYSCRKLGLYMCFFSAVVKNSNLISTQFIIFFFYCYKEMQLRENTALTVICLYRPSICMQMHVT